MHTHICTLHTYIWNACIHTYIDTSIHTQCGRITETKKADSGKTIVYFKDRNAAAKACRVNGTEYDGRIVRASSLGLTELPKVCVCMYVYTRVHVYFYSYKCMCMQGKGNSI